jgi:mono/diheme cytochrome c family protein
MRFLGRGYAVVALVGLAVSLAFFGREVFRREERSVSPAPVLSGRALFEAHCAVCHGPGGKGDGPGVRIIAQRLQDFSDAAAMRGVDDRFLFDIIKKGGSQFGRSNAMPSWGMKLSDDEIRALVAHIRSLAAVPSANSRGRKETP